jgi:hypothetical protein
MTMLELYDVWILAVLGWLTAAGALAAWIVETVQNRRREKAILKTATEQIERLTKVGDNWRRLWAEAEGRKRGDE